MKKLLFIKTFFAILYTTIDATILFEVLPMIYSNNIDDLMKQIKHIMIDKNIRQVDIVEKTGQSKATISNLLNCKSKNITVDTLLMLCKAIDCQLEINIKPKD